jgi:hypothetical protein
LDVQRAARERDPELAPAWQHYGSRALTTTLCARALGAIGHPARYGTAS